MEKWDSTNLTAKLTNIFILTIDQMTMHNLSAHCVTVLVRFTLRPVIELVSNSTSRQLLLVKTLPAKYQTADR